MSVYYKICFVFRLLDLLKRVKLALQLLTVNDKPVAVQRVYFRRLFSRNLNFDTRDDDVTRSYKEVNVQEGHGVQSTKRLARRLETASQASLLKYLQNIASQ